MMIEKKALTQEQSSLITMLLEKYKSRFTDKYANSLEQDKPCDEFLGLGFVKFKCESLKSHLSFVDEIIGNLSA
jgi:hypothetical protein